MVCCLNTAVFQVSVSEESANPSLDRDRGEDSRVDRARVPERLERSNIKEKRLIVNADDLGFSRGITDGILRAHEQGIVTSTSLMVNQPAAEYALAQIRHTPKLGVGIHLNICTGAPVLPPSEVPNLVTSEGKFYSPHQMVRRLECWRVPSRQIEAEFRAQIRWMKNRGIHPTHADAHHHLNTYPGAMSAFCNALAREGVSRARATRLRHYPRNGFIGGSHGGPVHRRLLVTAYMDLLQLSIQRRLTVPDDCVVAPPRHRSQWAQLLAEGWKLLLENLPPGSHELTCHPGFSEEGFSECDVLRERRELEFSILTDPEFRSAIDRAGVKLITYAEL